MVERGTLTADVVGSGVGAPASFDPKAVLDAVVDYNLAEIHKKMALHGVDFDLAWEMQKAVILAGARSK